MRGCFDDFAYGIAKALYRKPPLPVFARRQSQLSPSFRLSDQEINRRGKRMTIVCLRQQPCTSIINDLRDAAGPVSDDGSARRECFENDPSERFITCGRNRENI